MQGIRSYYSQYSNEKLLCRGVRESLIPWIWNFISNPHQTFKIDGFQSDRVSVNGGVPQGTKLGPVLFRVMINDMELRPTNNDHWKYVESYPLMIAVYISIFLFIEKWETWPSLFIYLFNFANYIYIHTRITYNGQMAGNTLQLTPITAAL